jgi:hypothetical protein
MTGRDLLDTNILGVRLPNERFKKTTNCATAGFESSGGRIHDLNPSAGGVRLDVAAQVAASAFDCGRHRSIERSRPHPADRSRWDMVSRAVEARAAYSIHFYDGMIVAAAERAGCENILSEDLNSQQKYFDVVVANPFH